MNVDLSSVKLPFSVGDMVSSGMQLINTIGPFVLLGLAFIFVPKIIRLIYSTWGEKDDPYVRDNMGNRVRGKDGHSLLKRDIGR